MKPVSLVLLMLFLPLGTVRAQSTGADPNRTQWWKEAKFGMFLHWGLYSVAAGDWKGKPYRGSEHFMLYERIPLREYAKLAESLNPTRFDAEFWARQARDAGMKYLVVTTKHHDGFAMYNSPSSPYNIVKATPFGRDPIRELADACKKYDLKLGLYYSLGRDWEDPDVPTHWPTKGGRSNLIDFPDEDAKDFSRYFERKVKPQIRELLTQYGPVGLLWFDTPELISKAQSQELKAMIHSLQPDCIINNRIGNDLGDYYVSEQQIAADKEAKLWEACITMSGQWSYSKYDHAWKSSELLVRQLVEIVSKGGNFLLNVNPKGDGSLPQPSIERLADIGRWMTVNHEAIYGTHPWEFTSEGVSEETLGEVIKKDTDNDATSKVIHPDLYFTSNGNNVYVFARSWTSRKLTVKSLKIGTKSVKSVLLLGAPNKPVWLQNEDGLTITFPKVRPNSVPIYVFKLTLE